MTAPKFYWCDDEFENENHLLNVIEGQLADQLCAADAGRVTDSEGFTYHLEISVKLVEKHKEDDEL